jgi:hypothetical protein
MSIWIFLTEWFGDVPTSLSLLKRMIINVFVASLTLVVLGIFDVSGHYAGLVGVALFTANFVMMVCYGQQRDRDRRR